MSTFVRMRNLRIAPVATIPSFNSAQAEFRSDRGDEADATLAEYATAALSAWHQGLISGVAYADALEEIADQLRRNAAEARRAG